MIKLEHLKSKIKTDDPFWNKSAILFVDCLTKYICQSNPHLLSKHKIMNEMLNFLNENNTEEVIGILHSNLNRKADFLYLAPVRVVSSIIMLIQVELKEEISKI